MTSHSPREALTRKLFLIAALVLAALTTSSLSWAQQYPDKPVRVIVPWPAGGIADVVVRIITIPLSERLRQPVVIENRIGANGIVGANAAAMAAADGYTVFAVTSEIVSVNPAIYAKLPYNVLSDFAPVMPVVHYFYTLTGRPDLPSGKTRDLVKVIQSQPGKITYASWGIGSLGHLGMESLSQANGLKMLHVPYTGGPGAFNAVLAGQVDLVLMPAGMAEGFRKTGKLKALAVPSGKRLKVMDDVPTLKEEGFDLEVVNHVGFVVPAKTSPNIVRRLHSEISAVMQMPKVHAALAVQAAEPFLLPPEEYARFIRMEIQRWGDVARKANVKIELEK